MNHILIGAGLPLLVALVVYACRGGRASMRFLILTPLAAGFGAVWSVVPDLPRLVGLHGLYRRLDAAPWCDIFFFHYTIDRWEDAGLDPLLYRLLPVLNACFLLLLLMLLGLAWRELARRERGAHL